MTTSTLPGNVKMKWTGNIFRFFWLQVSHWIEIQFNIFGVNEKIQLQNVNQFEQSEVYKEWSSIIPDICTTLLNGYKKCWEPFIGNKSFTTKGIEFIFYIQWYYLIYKVKSRNNSRKKVANTKWGDKAGKICTTPLAFSYSTAEYASPVWRNHHTQRKLTVFNTSRRSIKPTKLDDLDFHSGIASIQNDSPLSTHHALHGCDPMT